MDRGIIVWISLACRPRLNNYVHCFAKQWAGSKVAINRVNRFDREPTFDRMLYIKRKRFHEEKVEKGAFLLKIAFAPILNETALIKHVPNLFQLEKARLRKLVSRLCRALP